MKDHGNATTARRLGTRRSEPVVVDPFAVQPGEVLLERYCAIGVPVRTGGAWRLIATDMKRELGPAPNHRVVLHFYPTGEIEEHKLWSASQVEGEFQPLTHEVISVEGGTLVVADARGGQDLPGRLRSSDAFELARVLSRVLARLHQHGVVGVRFVEHDIVCLAGKYRLTGFAHLTASGNASSDTDALVSLLRRLAPRAFDAFLEPRPKDAKELFLAFNDTRDTGLSWSDVLPPEPPFVGRNSHVQRVMQNLAHARLARPKYMAFVGERGVGKSRLLRQLSADLKRGGNAMVLEATIDPESGTIRGPLGQIFDALVDGQSGLPSLEKDALASRIRKNTAPLTNVLGRISPSVRSWLGDETKVPKIDLGEDFARQANTVANAIRAIGTQSKPAVLIIDNLESADAGTIEALRVLFSTEEPHHTLLIAGARDGLPETLEPLLAVTPLDRFSPSELESVLKRSLPGDVENVHQVAECLYEQTEGNPFAAWLHLQSWLHEGKIDRTGIEHPWRLIHHELSDDKVVNLLAFRIQGLGNRTRFAALLSALHGGPTPTHWLSNTTEWTESTLGGVVNALVRQGIMQLDAEGTLTFIHDQVREMLIAAAPMDEKRRAHRAILASLRRDAREERCVQIAHHWELSEAPETKNDELAELHLRAGNHMLEAYELDRAEWHFRAAAKRGNEGILSTVLNGLASAKLIRGEQLEALELYKQAITKTEDVVVATKMASNATYSFICKSDHDTAREIALHALEHVGTPFPKTAFCTAFEIVRRLIAVVIGRQSRMSVPMRDALCHLYTRLGAALVTQPSLLCLSVLRGRYLAHNLDAPGASTALGFWGLFLTTLGRFEQAAQVMDRGEAIASKFNYSWGLGLLRHLRGHTIELPRGDYDAGMRSLEWGVNHFESCGDLSVAAISSMFSAFYSKDREHHREVYGHIRRGEIAANRQRNHLARHAIRSLELSLDARRNVSGTREKLDEFAQAFKDLEASLYLPDIITARSCIARAYLELGETGLACEHALEGFVMLPRGPVIESVLDIVPVTAESLLADGQGERSEMSAVLKRLRSVAKDSPRLRARRVLCEAIFAAQRGDSTRALKQFDRLLDGNDNGESYVTLQAARYVSTHFPVHRPDHVASILERISAELGLD